MQDDITTTADASISECGHDRFERNHYFHGKLMTARDMAAEQAYHARQRRAHARSVAGSGIAWGLETSIRDDGDAVVVAVERGYAIDECGRPIVVPQRREKTITDASKVNSSILSVYIRYEACLKESVPIDGAETACEDECAYNRVLEVYDIEVEAEGPGSGAAKRIESIDFPDWNTLESVSETGRETPSPTDEGLAAIAESYREAAPDETGTTDEMRLYLGTFKPGTNDPWVPHEDDLPTPFVYTNDMLYAATARHAADFGNPHETSLTTTDDGLDNGAVVHIRDDESTDSAVTLRGDNSVDVDHAADEQRIDLSVEEYVESEIEERIAPLEEYAVEKALKYKALVFEEAAERFDGQAGGTAGEIRDLARRAVDGRLANGEQLEIRDGEGNVIQKIDPEDYGALLTRFETMEQEFRDQVSEQVTDASYQRLSRALGELKSALKPSEPGLLELGSAQDDVVDAVEWLDPLEEEEEPEPEPGEATFTDGGTVQQTRGDIAEIGIELENTKSATLTVGSEDANYESTVTVQSGGDDQVTVLMNTYAAGQSAGAESQAFGTVQAEDSATATLNTSELPGPLDAGSYDLVLSVDGEETDVAALTLQARATEALTTYHGPADVYDTLTSAGEVLSAIDNGTVSGSGRVAPGETVVAEVAASGIYGAIASAFGDKTDVNPRGVLPLRGKEYLDLGVDQTDAVNVTPKRLDLSRSIKYDTAKLFTEPSDDRLLLVFDSGEAAFDGGDGGSTVKPAVNESYEASFTLMTPSGLVSTDEEVTDSFDMQQLIVQVPDIENTSYTQASMEATKRQLSLNPTYRQIDSPDYLSARTMYDHVVEQSPAPGTSVEAGSEVDVTVLTTRKIEDAVSGVSTKYQDILAEQGYEYIHELENASAAELEQYFSRVSESQIQNWIDQAQQERVATELSLREGTSIDESREMAKAFVNRDQTNIAAMTDSQIQNTIQWGAQNNFYGNQLMENYLANSENLTLVTGGSTTDVTDFF